MQFMTESEWRAAAERHRARVEPWITPRLERRKQQQRHPVDDFLFDYYSWRPAQLARWHPGVGVTLYGDVSSWSDVRGYVVDEGGAHADSTAVDSELVRQITDLLLATASRPGTFSCFARHEWAMVYGLDQEQARHSSWPLRVTPRQVSAVVDESPLRCTHFDAFRFYTDAARPLNVVQPTRATQVAFEQPGCLHATMDLYKAAFRCYPIVGADLTADCFALAREVREVDMRAAPYDLSTLGYAPIRIETAEGRAEFVDYQRDFAQRGATLRARLLDTLRGAAHPVSRVR